VRSARAGWGQSHRQRSNLDAPDQLESQPAKIVGVDVIEPRGRMIVAIDKEGDEHILRAA
jgi:hypothetical protein